MGLLFSLWAGVAGAAPRVAVALSPAYSGTDARGTLGVRVGAPDGAHTGVDLRLAAVRTGWIDGWGVSSGVAASALVHGTVPLHRGDRFRFDLRANVGGRLLSASETDAPVDRSWALLTEIGPRATLRVGDRAAVGLGFENVADFQLDPRFATDGLGQLLQGQLLVAPTDDWQLGIQGETGGLYGYDRDGAKYAARVGLTLRFAPRAAKDWLWL